MQKLITIYLTDDRNGDTGQKEHLEDYLTDGWSVVSITSVGGGAGAGHSDAYAYAVSGRFAVLMEK